MIDVEQRLRDAQARTAFLAEASNVLASSLDYETTLASVARLAVPEIADWCGVEIVQEDGSVRSVAVAHVDPSKVELARELQARVPFDPDAPVGVPHVLRTGEPEVIQEIPDELLVAALPDPELLRITRELGLRSSMVVPLIARGHVLGAITMVAAESGRLFGDADLDLAMDLAGRAALAVDNARLYRESQALAAHHEAILQQMADGVAILSPEGQVTFVNQAGLEIGGPPGRGLDDYVGSPEVLTLAGEPFNREELPAVRALRGETVTDAYWVICRRGVRTVLNGNAAPVRTADGALLGVVTVFRDVTAQVTLEGQKNTFLSAAAHDLKTPLTSVKALAQMLLRRVQRGDAPSSDAIVGGLVRIDSSVDGMTRLINELLDVTRIQMGTALEMNHAESDLLAILRQAVQDVQESTDQHGISLETLAGEIVGSWDADRMQRVFGNLVGNAVRYSPPGPVRVTVRMTGREGACWAEVAVADEGPGIPAGDLPHIFERFYRANNVRDRVSGTGIGLTSAKQIVEQHGGSIAVESEEGRGTTFTVRLPIRSSTVESSNG
jgi:PAS domain S-box-containing protein